MKRWRIGMLALAALAGLVMAGSWDGAEAEVANETPGVFPRAGVDSHDDVALMFDAVHRRARALDDQELALEARALAVDAMEQALERAVDRIERRSEGGPCGLEGGITRIYETMRPEQAAPILDRLDDETLGEIFADMETKKVAAIMAAMSKERAVAFTRMLAARQATGHPRAPERTPPGAR